MNSIWARNSWPGQPCGQAWATHCELGAASLSSRCHGGSLLESVSRVARMSEPPDRSAATRSIAAPAVRGTLFKRSRGLNKSLIGGGPRKSWQRIPTTSQARLLASALRLN